MIEGYRLSPQQKHLWTLQQKGLSHQAQCAILLEGALDVARLEDSVRSVIDQYEILRTSFELLPQLTTPVQVIAQQSELLWTTTEIAPQRYVLALTLPALSSDTKSLHNLMQLIAHAYESGSVDEETTQYVQFSEWQNELLEDEDPEGRAWWEQDPGTIGNGLTLPLERAASDSANTNGIVEQRLADFTGIDAYFLFACWQVLLWRLAGPAEFAVNYVCDGRKYEELAGALGLFAKAVPVTARFEDGIRFDEFLAQLSETARTAYAWQENYQPNGAGLPSIGFEYVERPANISARSVTFSIHKQSHQIDNFKLHLCCVRNGDSIVAEFHYDEAHFDADDVKRLAAQFATLVRSASSNPRTAIDGLEILDAAERRRMLFEWNQTTTEDKIEQLVHQLFEQQAAQTPDRIAVGCGHKQLTYAELNTRSNRLAHRLRRNGVGTRTPVGLYLERSIEVLVGLLGILKAGGAYVPLDPEHPAARLTLQLEEIEAPILVTQSTLANRLADFNGETICLDQNEFEDESDSHPEPINTPSDFCYVIYTSGSTGSPKGVAVTHQNLANYALFITRKLRARETPMNFATVSTLSADLGNTCIFPSLISGGTLHVLEQDVVMDNEKFADYFANNPCDVLKIVPSHLNALLGATEGRNILPRRYLLLGGEMLSGEHFNRISAAAGTCRIINHYGPTETTVGSLTFDASETGLRDGARSVPIGYPIANTQVYVLDRHMQPVPIGVPGELYIGGAGVASGYLNKPAQTAERFITHTFENWTTRVYKTGDLVRRLVDGSIEFLGRIDNQVKIRGFRIELGEIENALQQHEGVRQAVVLAREDEPGHKRLVAYIVAVAPPAPTVAELRALVAKSLPDYMVPSAFVVLNALPLTTNGKINRQALPAPDQVRPELASRYVAPRNEVEEQLVEIWKRVLAVPQVGINDNFFELGGDSILSLQIIAQATRLGLRIVPKQVFDFPTIALLAPEIEVVRIVEEEQALAADPVPLHAAPKTDGFTPSDFPEAALSQHELDQFLTALELN
jgi:amino acid adenylation domain-containing protein